MDKRFGTGISGESRSGSVSRELARCKLDLVGIQVRWDKAGTEPADGYTFIYGNRNVHPHLQTGFTHIHESYQQLGWFSL
jgi:hypothetical protein